MGCASSAPLTGETGPLGEIKNVANDMVESGENAVHEMGTVAVKTATDAVEHAKDAVNSAVHGIQDAATNIGNAAGDAVHSVTDKVKNEAANIMGAKDKAEKLTKQAATEKMDDLNDTIEDIMSTPSRKAADKFRPTPVPSFEKPSTPNTILEAPMAKIEEATPASIEEITDKLMKETAGVMDDAKTDGDGKAEDSEAKADGQEMSPEEAAEAGDVPTDMEDLRPTRWEALADAIVELPPKMSIDLGTGQIYAVVEDDPPPKPKPYKPAVIKKLPTEANLLAS